MPFKHEVPWDPQDQPRRSRVNPETDYEALMQAAPHEPIERSVQSLLPLREALNEAFEQLDERDRWIVNSILIERKSIRNTAKDLSLSKSYVDRLYKSSLNKLKVALVGHPVVMEYLDDERD